MKTRNQTLLPLAALCGLALATSPSVDAALTAGLVGYWSMDEASGDALNSASTGSSLDGTLVGDTTRVAGKVGSGALQFDGNGDYVDVTSPVIPGDAYTVAVWVNPAVTVGTTRQAILETSGSWAISMELSQTNLRLKYGVDTDQAAPGGVIKETSIDPVEGQWYYLVLSYDKTADVTKFFVDGAELFDVRGNPEGTLIASNGFHIGTYRDATGRWFNGRIDEVAVWDRALDDAEVSLLWNGGAGLAIPEPSFQLAIERNGADFDFSWGSREGKIYDLVSSTDLSTAPAAWPVYDPDGAGGIDPYGDIASGGSTTTLSAVPASDPRRFFAVVEKTPPPPPMRVIAHRGDPGNAPENTLVSIQAATTSADLVEFDVRVTADDELMLMHDTTIDRTTDGTGAFAALTLAQINTLDAGSWFSASFAGEPVPTLDEAITTSLNGGLEPLIEQKTGSAAAYHALFTARALDPDAFRVNSFDAGFINDLNALDPSYRLGWVSSGTFNQSAINSAKAIGADFLSWNHSTIDQAAVDLAHANGMELFVWTVNDAPRMQQLINFEIDGILTDDPILLRSLLP